MWKNFRYDAFNLVLTRTQEYIFLKNTFILNTLSNFLFYRSKSPSGKKGIKQVHLHKHDADELGMAILGGLEHGLPIIISEVFPNSAVGRCKKIYAGEDFFLNSLESLWD